MAADGLVYLRLSTEANSAGCDFPAGRFGVLRRGTRGTVIAVGPLAEAVLEAVCDLNVSVLYAATVRPFGARTLRETLSETGAAADVVVVEPYLAGTSVHGRARRAVTYSAGAPARRLMQSAASVD